MLDDARRLAHLALTSVHANLKVMLSLTYLIAALLTLLLIPREVSAVNIQTTTTPSPVTNETNQVTVTLTSDEPFFNTNINYTFQAWKSDSGISDCGVGSQYNLPGVVRTSDPKQLILRWELNKLCQKRPGLWNVGVWAGTLADLNTNNIYASTSYVLRSINDEPNSGQVSIYPAKPIYQLGETLQVTIVNPIRGRYYHFWWDGDWRDFAAISVRREGGIFDNIVNVLLPGNQNSFNISLGAGDTGERMLTPNPNLKLCLVDTDGWQPFGAPMLAPAFGGCKYSTTFNLVRIRTEPERLVCNILPQNPTAGDIVTLQVSGLPKNRNYQAYLVSNGAPTSVAQTQNSGQSGSVAIPLGSNLTVGSYSSYLQDESGQKYCENSDFITVPEPTPGAARPSGASGGQSCTPGQAGCTSSAGVSCNPNNPGGPAPTPIIPGPGVYTAIGCIPTDPLALVEAVVKFGTAIGGGIALLLMIAGALQMITSGGDQNKLQGAREQFTNAVIGLLFIIFSILLLQVIGVDILSIPGVTR